MVKRTDADGPADQPGEPGEAGERKLAWLETKPAVTRHMRRTRGSEGDDPVNETRETQDTRAGIRDAINDATLPGNSIPEEDAPVALGPGSVIGGGRFELGQVLGGGGMGVVFRAFDKELSRHVAIKFLRPSHKVTAEARIELLRSEARAIARLNHANIVHVYDLGIEDGQPYLVMELVAGEPLQDAIERGPLPFGEAMQIADQLLEGLKHAHAAGIVHRDLKPSNVLRVRGGRVAILDFGLAGLDGLDDDDSRVAGTPPYMAPEQWHSEKQDVRTDLWSFAVVLFEMLAGERPFHGRSVAELRDAALTGDPFARRPAEDPRLPPPIARTLVRALEKKPDRRFQNAGELQAALREATAGPPAAALTALPPEQRQVTLLACTLELQAAVQGRDALSDTIDDLDDGGGERLQHWQAEGARVAREHDGLVVSQVGIQLLVCFGYPTVSGGAPLLALQAAAAIRALTADLARDTSAEMAVHIGVATGLAIVEEPRDPLGRGVPVIQGPPAQIATTLAALAAPGEVLLSSRTSDLVRGWFAVEPVLRPGAPQAFRLGAPLDVATRFDVSASRELTPLHGRYVELALQAELWRKATDGTGTVLGLVGEAGMGKSRLVHVLKQRVAADSGTVMTAQCWPQRRRTPFHPLISLLRRSLGLGEGDIPSQRQALTDALAGFGPVLREEVALFATLLSIDGPQLAGPPEKLRARTIDRLSILLFEIAAIRPVLLIIEDVHWSDPSTLDWIDSILPRLADHRLLIVVTARPEFGSRWNGMPGYHEHRLTALSDADARSLAHELAAQLAVVPPPGLIEELVQRTGGVPFYLEELLRFVLAAQGPAQASARRQIPATLRDTLVASFDRLSAEARLVAQVGAVLEREFRDYFVEGLIDEVGVDVDRALSELEDAGVIAGKPQRPGSQLFFRHALLQEAAYQSLIPAKRRAYHSRAADILLMARSHGADVPSELLASHYDVAGRLPEALERWEEAGLAAARKWALREAVDQLGRALALLETGSGTAGRTQHELRLLLALGPPLMSVKGYAAAEVAKVYTRAYELVLAADGLGAELFSPLVGLWQVNMVGGNLPAARALSERLVDLANSSANPTLILIARRALGTTLFLQGEIAPAIAHTRAGLALYDRALHGTLAFQHGNDPGVGHCVYLAWSLWTYGAPEEARAIASQARELAQAISHPMSVAFSCCYSAIIENLCGDFARAAELVEHALEVARANQLELWMALAELQYGWALAGQGKLVEGIAAIQRGIAGWAKTGARAGTTFFYVVLAEAQARAGLVDEAVASLATAETMVAKNGEHFYEPELVRIAVRVAQRRGAGPAELVPRLRAALAQAERQRAGSWTLRLACDLVELASGTDLAPDAPDLLRHAIAGIVGGEGTADLARARELAGR
jgi:class 3 adenylate cyclase/tetratricopeptide (TPR) repeat protein